MWIQSAPSACCPSAFRCNPKCCGAYRRGWGWTVAKWWFEWLLNDFWMTSEWGKYGKIMMNHDEPWWTINFLGPFKKPWQDELQQLHRSNSEKIKELWQRQDKKSEVPMPEGDSCSVSWGIWNRSLLWSIGPYVSNILGYPNFWHMHISNARNGVKQRAFWTLYVWDDGRESCERAALFNSFLETIDIILKRNGFVFAPIQHRRKLRSMETYDLQ